MVEHTAWSRDLRVTADGQGVVAMAGAVGLQMLADRTGLTAGLSRVLARRGFTLAHDRGRVLADLAVAVACGARDIVDIEALRAQQELFGQVASDTTAVGRWARLAAGGAGGLLPPGPRPGRICGSSCQRVRRR